MEILKILQKRFEKNRNRHEKMTWDEVQKKLETQPNKLWSLNEMEETEGEPDVIGYDALTKTYLFCDCSPESPKARRSLCYDQEAWETRKTHKPKHSVVGMAAEMGIELLDEATYYHLQTLGTFDTKTSSWLATPSTIRVLGGAIFGDYRFGRVFIYHNGAESYYGGRGFRGMLTV